LSDIEAPGSNGRIATRVGLWVAYIGVGPINVRGFHPGPAVAELKPLLYEAAMGPVRAKETKMAEQQGLAAGHPDMDYAEHEKTYRLFTTLLKWSAIAIVIAIIILAYLTL
jgi:Bacterial aa3 type cytochrome c oxidase subunit IV